MNAHPFTAEQEARLRAIVRDEVDADNALRNSRNHAEFEIALAGERRHRVALEAKRTNGAVSE